MKLADFGSLRSPATSLSTIRSHGGGGGETCFYSAPEVLRQVIARYLAELACPYSHESDSIIS